MNKRVRHRLYSLFFLFFWMSSMAQGQISSNTVKYNVTYNPVNQVYTAWLIPDYNVPNTNNLGLTEFGGTAQFTVVVPKDFVITNISDVRGIWTKTTDSDFRKLGPGQTGQTWTGLNPALNYYLIGKAPSETNYGTFLQNVPVALFTFTGNSCYGTVQPLAANDPFITVADVTYGLNVANSFYSRSGQPSGGNQKPLEQFIAITGNAANCLPLQANPDAATTRAGISTNIVVLANDKNNDGTSATLATATNPTITTLPLKGLAVANLDGTISYAPFLGSTGTDTFIYTICDKINPTVCDTALVTINIIAVPQANPDAATAIAGISSNIIVLLNDKNPDGTPVILPLLAGVTNPTLTTSPIKGSASVNADGSIKYTPNFGTSGMDTFIYSICDKNNTSVCDTALVTITITPAPQAIPDVVNAIAGIGITISILGNDKNPDNTAVTDLSKITSPIITGIPLKGTAVVNANGTVTYTPFFAATGTDTFIYSICDKSNILICDTALVTIRINQKPVATNDFAIVPINKSVTGNVLTNDFDLDGNKLVVSNVPTSAPTKGILVLNTDGSYLYTPFAGVTGKDSFCYQLSDNGIPIGIDTACVSIHIIPAPVLENNKPIANDDNTQTNVAIPVIINVKANDIDPDGFATLGVPNRITNPTNGLVIQLPDGTFTYTPNVNFVGQDSFTYAICDSGNPSKCDTATVRIEVLPTPIGNKAPVAIDDAVETISGTPAIIFVKNNDFDPDGTLLTNLTNPTVITQPTSGTVTVNGNGSVTYTPNTPNFIGTATFKYAVCDLGIPAKCDTASVSVLVLAPNKVTVSPRAYLQGALIGIVLPDTLMRDDLRTKSLIPTTSPYLAGLTITNTTTTGVLAVTGKNAIVDWVFIELRSSTDPTLIIDSRSALIQRDGDIVGVDGISPISFSIANSGQYYLAVKHRNHLGVMSTLITLSNINKVIDFTNNATPTYNLDMLNIINQAQVTVQQGKALWAGNVLNDNEIIYQGTGNDVNVIYQEVINAAGNTFLSLSFKLKGYFSSDIDMNGEAIFQGTGNDVEFIYQNIIKNHVGNTLGLNFFKIKQQIP